MKKSHLCFIAVMLVCCILLGCAQPAAVPAPAPAAAPEAAAQGEAPSEQAQPVASTKDVLIVANKGDPGTLAPYTETSSDRGRITSTIYDTLLFLNEKGELEPVLATSWEWTDDTHVVFHLREGVKFHNGNDFKADDVLFTVQHALESATKDIYMAIDGPNCKVIDDYTFELALKKPDSIILSRFGATTYLSMLDKETCEADPDSMGTNPVGTGPYMLKDWIIGDTVTVERFDGYWGTLPPVKTIVYRKISEASQRVIELETGGVDFAYDIPFTSIGTIESNPNLQVLQRPGLLLNNLYFNGVEGKPCADVNLRKAIAYAIDYEAILKGAALGAGQVPASYVSRAAVNADMVNPTGDAWIKQDVAKAKEFMAASQYADGLTLEMYLNSENPLQVAAVEIMANQLKEIGITLNINQNSLGPLIGFILNTDNPWDIVMFGNAEGTALLQADRFDKAKCPFLQPHTPELQAICDKLWACTDDSKLPELLQELNTYIIDQMIIVPFHESLTIDAAVANLDGFKVDNQSYLLQNMFFK